MKTVKDYQVGQRLYLESLSSFRESRISQVVSIGRKWVYLERDYRFDPTTYRSKVPHLWVDYNGYPFPYSVWDSEEQYCQYQAYRESLKEIRHYFEQGNHSMWPSPEQLEKIRDILCLPPIHLTDTENETHN